MKHILYLFLFMTVSSTICHSLEGTGPQELYKQGMQAMQSEEYEDAIEYFSAVVELQPGMAAVHNLMGLAYMRQELTAHAIGAFLEAVKIDPNYAQAYFNLATIYVGPGDDKVTASEYYEKAVEADPNHIQANYGLAWIQLIEFNEIRKAIASFEKVVALSPDIPEAHYGLAMAYLKNNQRAMTLQPLSILRSLNRDDLASRIENIIRGNEGIVREEPLDASPYAPTSSALQESRPVPQAPAQNPQDIVSNSNIDPMDYLTETNKPEGSHSY